MTLYAIAICASCDATFLSPPLDPKFVRWAWELKELACCDHPSISWLRKGPDGVFIDIIEPKIHEPHGRFESILEDL